jgi:methylmalonyl-CoA/ethylmalonyl-CoA epimerase
LIEPVGGPSTWQEFLDENGEGVHHIAFRIKGTEQVIAFLAEKGIDVTQQGRYTGGMYTYINSAPVLGTILELLEDF